MVPALVAALALLATAPSLATDTPAPADVAAAQRALNHEPETTGTPVAADVAREAEPSASLQQSVDRISKMNVSGTPMFFVARNTGGKVTISKVVEGAQPFEAFKSAVDEVASGK